MRYDEIERFTDRVCSSIAKNLFGSLVEECDLEIAIDRNNGIAGNFKNTRKSRSRNMQCDFGFLAFDQFELESISSLLEVSIAFDRVLF